MSTRLPRLVEPTPLVALWWKAKDTLQLKAVFSVSGLATPCLAGTPNTEQCFQFQGQGTLPGLGHVTEQYTATMSNEGSASCQLLSFTPDVLTVAGKGEIDLSITVSAPCSGFPTGFTVTGGSGGTPALRAAAASSRTSSTTGSG